MRTTTTTGTAAPAARAERPLERALGHPAAFAATAVLLLALFGWTFVAHPDRAAPTKDPAYYTWRTEALITEEPQTLLGIVGPYDFFSSGYRVAAPVTGALLRHVPGISELNSTAVLMVMIPVVTALLLAAFAYRQTRDPLVWHSVALVSASLYLTPPFVGYLDNIFCLLFLAAALCFVSRVRHSWPARAAFALLLLGAGLTHPTTLAFFGMTLGLMSAVRLVRRRFDLRSVLRDDGPLLVTAAFSAAVTVVVWTVGIWGRPMPLTDAALAPPYEGSFFANRLLLWVKAMQPALNGPLILAGLAALLASWKAREDDDLARVGVVWLVPLVGLFGFLAGLSYPYYRFFNATLAWVLLAGVGAAALVRAVLARSRLAGAAVLAAVVSVVAANFLQGFSTSGWNDPRRSWIDAQTRADLRALQIALREVPRDTQVVFVIDQEQRNQQVYGFTKLSGNTSRFGMPDGMIDRGFVYLGSVENFLAGRPTSPDGRPLEPSSCDPAEAKAALMSGRTYAALSAESLCDVQENSSGGTLVVVARAFNRSGFNAALAAGERDAPSERVWVVRDGAVFTPSGEIRSPEPPRAPAWHLVRVLAGFALLLVPGLLSVRFFAGESHPALALGLVPALSLAMLSVTGTALLAVLRSPFGTEVAAATVALCAVAGALLAARARRRLA